MPLDRIDQEIFEAAEAEIAFRNRLPLTHTDAAPVIGSSTVCTEVEVDPLDAPALPEVTE